MPMLVYKPSHALSSEFVAFWSRVYEEQEDESENLYTVNIGRELTESSILKLFKWKNGGRLSKLKEQSVRRNFIEPQQRGKLETLQPGEKTEELLAHFPEGGVIFRIFWLHCWQPNRFPIYDQHVHRAMTYIQTGTIVEVSSNDKTKIASYIDRYVPFYATFDGLNLKKDRDVDKALWSFGKFLKTDYVSFLCGEGNFATDMLWRNMTALRIAGVS